VVRPYAEHDRERWNRFAMEHPHASPFHLTAWQETIRDSFAYQPVYLLAEEGDAIQGILPLFLVRNRIIGKALISSPFAVYGGILANSREAREALYLRALEMGESLGVDYIEFRNAWPEQCVGRPNVDRYATFGRELQSGGEALLEELPKKTRNVIRKSLKQPFTVRYGVTDPARFDALHARNMRRLGTPCFPREYFARLLENFGSMADIREVWLDRQLMAVSLNFFFRGEMHTYYAAADTRFNSMSPNTFMYFDHLCWAARNGLQRFDFGRSKKGTGPFEFKRHWNTVMRELPYEIVLVRRKELPNFSPANPRFELAIRLWQRLPLFLTRILGPRLIRLFP
jgi:FemAB-related protein (PEP-CTERM system-associated)